MPIEDIIFDSSQIWECLNRADTLGHDTMMVCVECPFISATIAKSEPTIKIVLSLFSGDELLGERLVTTSYRQHQFLVPISAAHRHLPLVIKTKVIEFAGVNAQQKFITQLESCLRRDLVNSIEEKMIWVFGSPRSGSTWLARDIICRLPSQSRPSDVGRNRLVDEMGIGTVLGAFLFDPEHFYKIDQVVDHRDPGPDLETATARRAIRNEPLFQRILFKNYNNPESMLSDRTRHAIRDLIREATFNHVLLYWGVLNYDRVVFKAPNEGHAADLLMEALPKACMIFLIRDGRDVVKSRFSPFASRVLAKSEDPELRRAAVAYYAHQWNWHTDIVRSAYDAHDPARRLLLTYEELRRESEDAFLRLARFLNAPMEPQALKDLISEVRLENVAETERGPDQPRQEGKIGGYRSYFSPDEIKLMTSIMTDSLVRYGYDRKASVLPKLAVQFLDVRDRMPEGISLFVANGLYHDLWCADRVLLICSLPHPVRSVSVTCQIPADFFSVHHSWTITFTGDNYSRTATIVDQNPITLTLPLVREKDEPITLTFSSDKSIFPSKDLGQVDERRLSFSIVRIEVARS